MITKLEVLNTIAAKHGHADWSIACFRSSDNKINEMHLEAMDLYAEQSNSHKPVVGGPASASAKEGEQLPAEGQAQNGRDGFCYSWIALSNPICKEQCERCKPNGDLRGGSDKVSLWQRL